MKAEALYTSFVVVGLMGTFFELDLILPLTYFTLVLIVVLVVCFRVCFGQCCPRFCCSCGAPRTRTTPRLASSPFFGYERGMREH